MTMSRWRAGAILLVLTVVACDRPPGEVTGPDPAVRRTSSGSATIGVNVLLDGPATPTELAELGTLGTVLDQIPELNALTMRATESALPSIQALPYVVAANPDAEREGAPVDRVPFTDFTVGVSTWDQDAVNVTAGPGVGTRTTAFTGEGVYCGVLDTGLLDSWRSYFPQERIAEQYAISFGGGGGNVGTVSSQPNKWEHDQNSHGTHVTSTIIGYSFNGTPVSGVAPKCTVIPVKVLNQNGSGWSSVVARGIVYVADLKSGPLHDAPVVINMSLGGPRLDALEKAAVDYAVAKGVVIVAAAGNSGDRGMDFPGAYAPVISAAASGWVGEWVGGSSWWFARDVADPTNPADYYITDFSGRAKAGQDLDVAAPGSWVVGPFQLNSGQLSYFFLGGTSMATPHVAGIVALMLQKHPGLTATQVEAILESTAVPLGAGSRTIRNPDGTTRTVTWGTDATGAGLVTANAALAGTP